MTQRSISPTPTRFVPDTLHIVAREWVRPYRAGLVWHVVWWFDVVRAVAMEAAGIGRLVEGIKLVGQQMISVLKQNQCEEIAALGAEFNPQFHAAILQEPSNDVPANHVIMVTQAGYQLHDRVVRPAQVIVSSGPP